MVKANAELERTEEILMEFAHVNELIQRRGIELLRNRTAFHDKTIGDWLDAERALATQPVFEVRRVGDTVEVLAALVDVDPNAIAIEATSETLVIHSSTPLGNGRQVHLSIHLPERVVPTSIHSEFRDGLLHVTADVDRSAASQVRVSVGA